MCTIDRAGPGMIPRKELKTMTDIRQSGIEDEPMGIVISRGSRAEAHPRFAAYVWCYVGDVTPATEEPRAA